MDYGTSAFDYFKTYYLGRAWLELALTEVQTRGYGFNFISENGNAIITENFDYESGLNYFSYTITGRHLTFQETVQTGNFLTLPLFYDDTWKYKSHFQNLNWDNQTIQAYNFANNIGSFKVEWDNSNNTNTWLLMSLLVYDTWMAYMQDIIQTTWTSFSKITNTIETCIDGSKNKEGPPCDTYQSEYLEVGLAQKHRSFIMIKNTTDQPITFSWIDNTSNTSKEWITLLKSKVIVLAHYHDDEISMEAEYSKPVPAFFGATIGI